MNHDKLIRELEKLGYKVEENPDRKGFFECMGNNHKCKWFKKGEDACCVKIMKKNESDDPSRDYFTGFFVETYKDVKKYISQ